MSKKEHFVDRFLFFEEKYELFSLQIKGVYIWPIIRFNVYSLLLEKSSNTQESHPKQNVLLSLLLSLRNFIPSIIKSPFFIRHSKTTIILNHKRKVKNESGLFECKYTEHLINEDSYVLEAPFYDKHFKPSSTKNVFYLDLILNIARIYSIYGSKKQIGKNESSKLERLNAVFKSEFGLNINGFNSYVMKMIFKHKAISFFAKKIFSKVKPEQLIVAVSYSDANMPFVEQAKSLGIRVIEIQHGILGRNHIAYNFMKKENFGWFPDEIWVWNKFWKESSRFPISEDKIIVKGFPFLDRYKSKWNSKNTEKKQLLIFSQGPYSDKLIEFTRRLSHKINPLEYQIVFKPHPSELISVGDKFQQLTQENIIISEESNIYNLFGASLIQIGVNSTALFEGLEFGLKTFVLDIEHDGFWDNVDNVVIVKNQDAVVQYLNDNKKL